jgi:glyoxylate/hydroxypyruvate reductase A
MAVNLVLISRGPEFTDEWQSAFAGIESVNIVAEGDPESLSAIGALVWEPPRGALKRYRHLKAVFNLGAGVDVLIADSSLREVPIVRLENSGMCALMPEYVLYQVLRIHRSFGEVERRQREAMWGWMPPAIPARNCRVTVLGIGRLGLPTAKALRAVGFTVSGWSRTPKALPGVPCYVGRDSLENLLPTTDIVICMLPLTDETRGLLNASLFRLLPRGASVINASRAGCVNESDLLAALESGQLGHATLDCFDVEPLPESHAFWRHPLVTVTPHMAADPAASACVGEIVANVERLIRGQPMHGVVDRIRGY